jgi:hypothetical protein
MSDPGTPSDPNQPGWASPTPPPVPPGPEPSPPPPVPPTPPVATAPGGAGWTPPPAPAKKRRLTWLWILIPVLALFLVSLVLVIVFAVRLFVGPLEATEDYFAALRDTDYREAYSLRCDRFQRTTPLQEFEAEHSRITIGDFDLDDFDTDGDDATTGGSVEIDGRDISVTVELEREDGDWKICGVSPIDRVFDSGLFSP